METYQMYEQCQHLPQMWWERIKKRVTFNKFALNCLALIGNAPFNAFCHIEKSQYFIASYEAIRKL